MRNIKWKTIIITSAVCLAPILLGAALWDSLPDKIAIHINFKGEPDNFASKAFTVFGLPLMMTFFQIFCCVTSDISMKKQSSSKKSEIVTKWIIPCMTAVLYMLTLGYSLGRNIDIRKATGLIIGIILIVTGNYLPKFSYVKNIKTDEEKAKKVNRFTGYLTVIMGFIALVTIFLPPVSLIVWLFLWIPYAAITVIYTIKIRNAD